MTPYGAKNITYSIIDIGDEGKIAQVDFTLDEIEYTYRASAASVWTDISGMYYNWTEEVETNVSLVLYRITNYYRFSYKDDYLSRM